MPQEKVDLNMALNSNIMNDDYQYWLGIFHQLTKDKY